MRITASRVAEGDIVRGLGLVVEYSEPETDFTTRLEGYVSTREANGVDYDRFATRIVVPNDHVVNVRRSDAAFRADMVTEAQSALDDYLDDDDHARMHTRLLEVANRPRGAYVESETVSEIFSYLLGSSDVPTGEGFVATVEEHLTAVGV